MALFYRGERPVLKGRNSSNAKNPYKGNVAGTYSYWVNYHTEHVFDGAPDAHYVPGSGQFPNGLQMSRWYRGLDTKQPMDNSGGGTRLANMRYRPFEKKATAGAQVFYSAYGRTAAQRYARGYSFDDYSHTNRTQVLDEAGHAIRGVNATGAAATFGRFDPHVNKGIGDLPFSGSWGQARPATAQNDYGRNRVNEWRGVASAKAINV